MQMNSALLEQTLHYKAVKARLHARAHRPVPVVVAAPPPPPEPVRDVLMVATNPITKAVEETNQLPEFMVYRKVSTGVREIAEKHGVSKDELFANRRLKKIVWARQEAMWWVKKNTPWSLPRVGRFFGGYDHTTILHACRMHESRIASGLAK